MKQKYIIIKNSPPLDANVLGANAIGVNNSHLANSLSQMLSIEELSKKEIRLLLRDKTVRSASPVMPMSLIEPVKHDHVNATPTNAAWGITTIGADQSPYTGKGVTVAILDTGIDKNHEAFSGLNIIEEDFTGEGNGDLHGHGTHCAGTFFGGKVNGISIGVAPNVEKVLAGKVLDKNGSGNSGNILDAIVWAIKNGANIISLSVGIDFSRDVTEKVNSGMPIQAATSNALQAYWATISLFEAMMSGLEAEMLAGIRQPVVFIAAGGNSSDRYNEEKPFEVFVIPPAASRGFISIGALQQNTGGLQITKYSNTGVNISAPGEKILSARRGGGLTTMSGTSMAAPHVAGVTALFAEKLLKSGTLTSANLVANLLASAKTNSLQPNFDPLDIGAGLVLAP